MTTRIRFVHAAVFVSLLLVPALAVHAQAPATPVHTSFRVQVTGQGRPMILIPGFMSSGDTWKSTVARYQDRFQCDVPSKAVHGTIRRFSISS